MAGSAVLTVTCALYYGRDEPDYSADVFTPEWADKLYRAVRRNYTGNLLFVVLTNEPQASFAEPVETMKFLNYHDNKWCLIECLRVTGSPVLFMGLDTMITGSLDEIATYDGSFAMTRDPYRDRMCSGVMMWHDNRHLYDRFVSDERKSEYRLNGRPSDMVWLDKNTSPDDLDALFPGQIRSYKAHVLKDGLGDARIVYFHGRKKPHEEDNELIRQHWK